MTVRHDGRLHGMRIWAEPASMYAMLLWMRVTQTTREAKDRGGWILEAPISTTSDRLASTLPSILAIATFLYSSRLSAKARVKLERQNRPTVPADATSGPSPEAQPDGISLKPAAFAKQLDWAIDYTQLAFVIFIPVIAALFLLPSGLVQSISIAVLGFLSIGAVYWIAEYDPRAYATGRTRLNLTPVSIWGVIINIVIVVLLATGVLSAPSIHLARASDIEVASVEAETSAPRTFHAVLSVSGGADALAGRTVWMANKLTTDTGSSLYFTPRPCIADTGQPDKLYCSGIQLGVEGDSPGKYNLYVMIVDGSGVSAILDGRASNADGHIAVPLGADVREPYQYPPSS